MTTPAQVELQALLGVMAALRDPDHGCPWDRQQTFATIAPYTIDEAYEVADAIAHRDWPALADELGDLLFQVVYHARLAEEAGLFAFADVAAAIAGKMRRRHPHVFPPDIAPRVAASDADTVHAAVASPRQQPAAAVRPPAAPESAASSGDETARQAAAWEAAKARERAAAAVAGRTPPAAILADIPPALPALSRAARITRRVAAVGFDWPDAPAVLDRLAEEIAELRAELAAADPARLADELGDMLFVTANLARKLALDAETCLRQANAKFTRRFTAVEARLAAAGSTPAEAGLAGMEAAWQQVKAAERAGPAAPAS